MNRALFASFAVAALALPGIAQAHTTRAELRHDVRTVHQERHELTHARYHHTKKAIAEERRELKSARRELREDARNFHRTHRH